MFTLLRQCFRPLGLRPALLLILCMGGPCFCLSGAEPVRRSFAIPAGDAEATLEAFSDQAGVQIVYLLGDMRGEKTNPVQGVFAIRTALDRLIGNTALRVVVDGKTQAFVIQRSRSRPASAELPKNPNPTPPPPMKKSLTTRLAAVLAAVTASVLTAQPEPATSAPTDAAKPGDAIRLSEFRVDTSKDRGYLATNATTGTRLNMSIKEIPLPIEVITREFIDDIGAVDIKESLRYSAGIVQDTVTTSNSFTFSPSGSGNANSINRDSVQINIRGFNTRSFLRNGFRQDTVTDVVNIDRQEIARGPQALLYGVAALGGIVNITPKYPRNTQRTTGRFAIGSEDFYRAELYNTGPILKSRPNGDRSLNYGIGFVYQNQSSADDFDDRRRILMTPSLDFRPFKNTNIFVDVEYGQFRTEGNGFKDINDANAGNIINPFGLRTREDISVYNETKTVARDRFGKGRFFRWSGGDTFQKNEYFSGTVEVTQKIFDGLTAIVGGNYSDSLVTNRGLDSQGIATANTASSAIVPTGLGIWTNVGANPTNAAQNYWKTVNYQWNDARTHKLIKQFRAELTYELNLWGNKQVILLGRQEQTVAQINRSTAQVTSNITGGSNRSYKAFDDLSYIADRGEQTRIFRETPFWEWNTGEYATYQGKWWENKITIIGGLRWNRYMVRTYDNTFVKADATQPDSNVANWVKPAAPDPGSLTSAAGQTPVINGYRFANIPQKDTSPTAGVSFALTKAVSLYAVTAGGIYPNTGQRDGAASPFQAEKTKSKEVGVKFDVWKDKRGRDRISATVAGFQIDRENAIYNLFWAPQPRSNNQATLRAGFTANAPVSGTGLNAYTVTNSAFTTFQTANPVTYLVPVTYVAAVDLASPRVTGAPQANNLILVDYASLGSAATDPLRRALDAAANDANNLTALQNATTGNGAGNLNANNGYALNRNSDTSYNDQTKGVDMQIYLNLTDHLTTVFTYTHLYQGVTGGFKVVDQVKSTEYDSWWNYMGIPLADRGKNLDESTYDFSGQTVGRRTLDNPRNQLSIWNKYDFTDGALKGLDVGLGVNFNGPRQSEALLNNGARTTAGVENIRYKPQFKADYKINLGLGYRTQLIRRNWNFRLNVNNVLNEQKKMATGSSSLYVSPADIAGTNILAGSLVPSTTAGAQKITVPERVVRYFDPISFRFTLSTSF
ncbi:MAG: TonB-dependent receptor [Undibacterium sp.]|nr:TonB-dependent receptor [Opitutaceae bacterium]